jgi:hypothetical protein
VYLATPLVLLLLLVAPAGMFVVDAIGHGPALVGETVALVHRGAVLTTF